MPPYSEIHGPVDGFWWKKRTEDLYGCLFSIINHLDDTQRSISAANLRHLRLYGNQEMLGLTVGGYSRAENNLESKLRMNLIQAVTDTLAAKISKNNPKPTFLTQGGDWSLQRKAKLLDQYCQGIYYEDDLYTKGKQIFLDGCVWGTGVLKIFEQDGKPCSERVLCDEIKFDNADAFYGSPRSMYQTKFYNREVLLDMYPEHKLAIGAATSEQNQRITLSNLQLTDQVKVIEAWHLPSSKGSGDGRHCIVIDKATLLDEPWKTMRFPFVFFKLLPKMVGFWGLGVAESLTPLQIELNKLLRTLQASMHLVSVPRVLVDINSKIIRSHFNNEVGAQIEYDGNLGKPPEFWAGGGIPPELFKQIDAYWNRGFEQFGISMLSATSEKPAGLDAAVALREYNDIETERFVLVGQRYEKFFIECAPHFIDIASKNKKRLVNTRKKNWLQPVAWEQIALDPDDYQIQMFPTSSLPTRPEARLEKVQEMAQAGWITPPQAMRLLDFPDTEAFASIANAPEEIFDMLLEHMIEEGDYQPPEPYMNLEYGISHFQAAYLRAKINKVPDERLDLLRRWMSEADQMLQIAAPPPPIDPAAPISPPGAVPEAPPTSELMPMVPQTDTMQ